MCKSLACWVYYAGQNSLTWADFTTIIKAMLRESSSLSCQRVIVACGEESPVVLYQKYCLAASGVQVNCI